MRHYFVDEAGDGVLFNDKGRVIIGQDGCSRYFILGLAYTDDVEALSQELEDLRAHLLADPYFRGVPSMQPNQRKTAVTFHAKDDLPEVRREVYTVLRNHNLRFFAMIKTKQAVLQYVRERQQKEPSYRYHPNELYDFLVRRLLKPVLNHDGEYKILFANRGKADRTMALREQLKIALSRAVDQHGISQDTPIEVVCTDPGGCAGIQAADYCLWALQRFYERGDSRYIQYIWPKFRLVIDIDDTSRQPNVVYYNQKRPLSF